MSAIVLADLATQINAEHAAATDHARSAVQSARKAGELLLQAKTQCSHGEWLPWLKAHCPDISQRTAQGYMRLARYCLRSPHDTERIETLPLREALTCLAAPKSATRFAIGLNEPTFFETCVAHIEERARQERRLEDLESELDAIDRELATGCDDDRKAQHLQRLADICDDHNLETDIATLRIRMLVHLGHAFKDGMSLAEALEAEPETIAAALGVDAGISLEDWYTSGAPISAETPA